MATATATGFRRSTAEKKLVEAMGDAIEGSGYRLVSHNVKVNHERRETTLTVTFVLPNPDQGELPLGKASQNGEAPED